MKHGAATRGGPAFPPNTILKIEADLQAEDIALLLGKRPLRVHFLELVSVDLVVPAQRRPPVLRAVVDAWAGVEHVVLEETEIRLRILHAEFRLRADEPVRGKTIRH